MRNISIEELKKLQFDILCFVDDFCRKNEIHYWIDCGTLLGAVRHKGYIPWDDDIDIGMLREDYEKFIMLFPGSSDRYILKSAELNEDYFIPFGKVIDDNTILYEPDKNGYKLAVYIDVFVYDNAPDDEKILSKMFDRRDLLRRLNHAQTGYHRKTPMIFKEIAYHIGKTILKVFPRGYFNKKSIELCKQYNNKITKRIGNFTSETRMTGEKSIFENFVEIEFEGRLFKAPSGYDKWLHAFYGDYMKLPPKEKRVSHHEFEAFLLK